MAPQFLKPAILEWTESGQPISTTYGDVYFSREDGLAESRAVFLAGCGLPDAWRGRRHFTVAELGFGTGLNILALLDLWVRERPAGGHLHIWSLEAHPLSRAAMARAHEAWPELARVSQQVLARWPDLTPGPHRIDLPDWHATLDLAFGEAVPMLEQWSGQADAWFLDGFAPATNPAMWSDEVLALVAGRSAPGARVGTFTVAGQVRRGLAAGGFAVEKKPGHGRKRERLEARFPGTPTDPEHLARIAVLGGGIAGASLVRAFRHLGQSVTLIEAERPGAGASGAPAALVTPWVDAGLSPAAVLAAQAFLRAVDLYQHETPGAVIERGVLRLARDGADQTRLQAIANQPIWPTGLFSPQDALADAAQMGERTGQPGVWLDAALVIEPRKVLEAWLKDTEVIVDGVRAVRPGPAPVVVFEDGREQTFDAVVIAAGWGSRALGLRSVSPVRGQVAWVEGVSPGCPTIWGPGYAVPMRSGTLVGATHDRGREDAAVDPADNDQLMIRLAQARPALAGALSERALSARAAVRAVTADHRPLCGRLEPGVWTLTGLGGRGFMWAPLLAEHLVAEICATPSPLLADHLALLSPQRGAGSSNAGANK